MSTFVYSRSKTGSAGGLDLELRELETVAKVLEISYEMRLIDVPVHGCDIGQFGGLLTWRVSKRFDTERDRQIRMYNLGATLTQFRNNFSS